MVEETFVQKFAKILADQRSIDKKEAFLIAEDFKTRSKESLVYFLIDEGLVPKDEILKALNRYFNIPSFDAIGYFFDNSLVGMFPIEFLTSNGVVPMSLEQGIMTVVASDPDQSGLRARIMEYTDADIEFVVGIKRDIWDAAREYSQKSLTAENTAEEEEEIGQDESVVDEEAI